MTVLKLSPKRLPDVATGIGKAIRDFRKATKDLQDHIDADESVSKPLQELRAALLDSLRHHFIADVPPEASVKRIETAFNDTGGDLKAVYRAIIDEATSFVRITQSILSTTSPLNYEWTRALLVLNDDRGCSVIFQRFSG